MGAKEDARNKSLSSEGATDVFEDDIVTSKGRGNAFISKSMTIRGDQYMDVTAFAAYNKLTRKKPDTVSAVLREAIDLYLSEADDTFRHIGGR
jgi:hypothetical protein